METIITSTQNPTVKYFKSLNTKKGRAEHGVFLTEGEKCVNELIKHMPQMLQSVIISDDKYANIAAFAENMGKSVYRASPRVMNAVCDGKTPQGIAAAAKIPSFDTVQNGFIAALDGVRDPRNIGTIIRTADAGGCSGVVLSPCCADCYSPKALRASMGSIFHLPVTRANLKSYLSRLLALGYNIACADLDGDTEYRLDKYKTCLVIGNESRGISPEILSAATHRIRIPMYGKAESLNAAVAAGILIYKILN
ncbi:MAG: RNA methyltransferase [Christensenellales bacterium]